MRHPFWKYLLVTALLVAAALSMPLTTRQLALEYPPQTLRCVIDLKGEPVRGLTVGMNKIILREFADDRGPAGHVPGGQPPRRRLHQYDPLP